MRTVLLRLYPSTIICKSDWAIRGLYHLQYFIPGQSLDMSCVIVRFQYTKTFGRWYWETGSKNIHRDIALCGQDICQKFVSNTFRRVVEKIKNYSFGFQPFFILLQRRHILQWQSSLANESITCFSHSYVVSVTWMGPNAIIQAGGSLAV